MSGAMCVCAWLIVCVSVNVCVFDRISEIIESKHNSRSTTVVFVCPQIKMMSSWSVSDAMWQAFHHH